MEVHVCSLSRLAATVEATGARHVVTLINQGTPVSRPAAVQAEDHLFLDMNDIVTPMEGYVAPGEAHVDRLLGFVDGWWRSHGTASPLVVHCWAGISRSTAAAYITACALAPERDETELALALRQASATATPNPLLVALADEMRPGRDPAVRRVPAFGRNSGRLR